MRLAVFIILALLFNPIQAQSVVTIESYTVHTSEDHLTIQHFVLRHTVQSGETLNGLGRRFLPEGADPTLIRRRHTDPDLLEAGEVIVIIVAPWEISQWDTSDKLRWKELLPHGKMSEFNQVLKDEDLYWNWFKKAQEYRRITSQ